MWVVLGISYSSGHPDQRIRERLGSGLTEKPCRNCHDKLAFLEVRAEFEESYWKGRLGPDSRKPGTSGQRVFILYPEVVHGRYLSGRVRV